MPTLLGNTGEEAVDDAGDGQHGDGTDDRDEREEAATGLGRRLPAVPSWLPTATVAGITVVAVVLRLYSPSKLWLDEALSLNIAQLPVGDLLEALRHDGHPPFYYLLLHYWADVVGDSDVAVRLLSSIFGVACLPLAWAAGRRLAGVAGGRWALVVAGLSPYAIRYSTETRMYSLVMLLVLAGYLLLTDALRDPRAWRLAGVAVIAGLLLLTHYWSFWLLGAVGLMLMWRWWRDPDRRAPTIRVLGAVAAGGLLFLPWVPAFLYQSSHTGTPWGGPMRPTSIVHATLADLGGGSNLAEGSVTGYIVAVLCLLALFAVQTTGRQIVLDVGTAPTVRRELGITVLTLAVGCVTAYATNATFQSRYAAVVVPFILLSAAVGLTRIPGVGQLLVGAAVVGLSLGGVGWSWYFERTQSADVATQIAAHAQPGDVVVYCPDQLGPAYSREIDDEVPVADDLVQVSYPTLLAPDRVDWVDYAERNAAADPAAIAEEVRQRAGGRGVFVVWRAGYETFGQQCAEMVHALGQGRAAETLINADEGRYYEPAGLLWYDSVADVAN